MFGTNYALKYLRHTDAAKQLAKAIADTKQYDAVLQKTDHRLISGYAETVYQPNGGEVANIVRALFLCHFEELGARKIQFSTPSSFLTVPEFLKKSLIQPLLFTFENTKGTLEEYLLT